jgi:hypothetical protein
LICEQPCSRSCQRAHPSIAIRHLNSSPSSSTSTMARERYTGALSRKVVISSVCALCSFFAFASSFCHHLYGCFVYELLRDIAAHSTSASHSHSTTPTDTQVLHARGRCPSHPRRRRSVDRRDCVPCKGLCGECHPVPQPTPIPPSLVSTSVWRVFRFFCFDTMM